MKKIELEDFRDAMALASTDELLDAMDRLRTLKPSDLPIAWLGNALGFTERGLLIEATRVVVFL